MDVQRLLGEKPSFLPVLSSFLSCPEMTPFQSSVTAQVSAR